MICCSAIDQPLLPTFPDSKTRIHILHAIGPIRSLCLPPPSRKSQPPECIKGAPHPYTSLQLLPPPAPCTLSRGTDYPPPVNSTSSRCPLGPSSEKGGDLESVVSTSSCGLDVFTRWSSASARGGGGARVQAPDGRQVPPSVNTERSIVGEGGLSRGYRQQVRSSMSVTSGHWHRPCWLGRADLADGEMVEEDDRTATYRSMERGWELRV